MGRKIQTFILLLLSLSVVFLISVFYSYRSRFKTPLEISIEKRRQYFENCEQTLIDSGRDYVICSLDENGKMYLANDKRVFKPGEYLGLHVNVQRLNEYFDPYYMCVYSNFPNYQEYKPDVTHGEFKVCGSLYSQKDYRNVRFSAYVADLPGEYTLVEIYLFPESNFSSEEEFFNNLDKSVLVFNMTGEIK